MIYMKIHCLNARLLKEIIIKKWAKGICDASVGYTKASRLTIL